MPTSPRRFLGWSGVLLLLLVAFGADVGLVLLTRDGDFAPSWLTLTGATAAVVVLSPRRRWPAVALGVALVTAAGALSYGASSATVVWLGAGQGLEALVAAAILSPARDRTPRLVTLGDVGRLVLAGLAVASLAALVTSPESVLAISQAPGSGLGTGLQPGGRVGAPDVVATFAGHLTAVLLTLPVALTLFGRPTLARRPELVAQVVALAVATGVVFARPSILPVAFALFPLLVWAALRLDVRVAAWETSLLSLVTVVLSTRGHGPFALASLPDDITDAFGAAALAHGYVLCVALVTLPLAVAVQQRDTLLAAARRDEERFRRSFLDSPLGMLLLGERDGHLVVDEANRAAGAMLRRPSSAPLAGRRLDELLDPLAASDRVTARLLDGTIDSWWGQARAAARPGSRLQVGATLLETRGARPGSRTWSVQLIDVTQEHEARRRLDEAHQLTDATLDTTPCLILVTDSAGTVLRVNAAAGEITGYGAGALVGRPLWDTPLWPDDRGEVEAMFAWPNRSGFPIVTERLSRTATGEALRLVWNSNIVRDAFGLPSYGVFTGIDVTSERSSTGLMTHLMEAAIATALVGIDTSGRITLFNSGAQHLLGHQAGDMVGRPFVDLLDPEELESRTGAAGPAEAFLCLVGLIGAGNESPARDWTWRTKGGRELIVSMTLSVTDDDVDSRVGFLCVGRDVTEQREGQETLVEALEKERTALDRLRSLDRAKDEFVSTVSHELRTPITSIIGYTELLRDGAVVEAHPEQVAMLDTIARNGRRLITICDDLLLLSGFESGSARQVREPVDLRGSVAAVEEFTQPLLRGRDLALTVESPSCPVTVSGDRAQLDRVLVNLVSNAIKFTEDGGTVGVRLERTGGEAVLTVHDSGIGIAAADHAAVFQRFYRTASAQSRAIPGTGLGLSIVASIVASHDGTVEVESQPGHGTSFTVRLPLARALVSSPAPG